MNVIGSIFVGCALGVVAAVLYVYEYYGMEQSTLSQALEYLLQPLVTL